MELNACINRALDGDLAFRERVNHYASVYARPDEPVVTMQSDITIGMHVQPSPALRAAVEAASRQPGKLEPLSPTGRALTAATRAFNRGGWALAALLAPGLPASPARAWAQGWLYGAFSAFLVGLLLWGLR